MGSVIFLLVTLAFSILFHHLFFSENAIKSRNREKALVDKELLTKVKIKVKELSHLRIFKDLIDFRSNIVYNDDERSFDILVSSGELHEELKKLYESLESIENKIQNNKFN